MKKCSGASILPKPRMYVAYSAISTNFFNLPSPISTEFIISPLFSTNVLFCLIYVSLLPLF